MARILVIDNYDSFVFNLVQYLAQLGAECTVVRNDEVAASEAARYDGVLISPGPGPPDSPPSASAGRVFVDRAQRLPDSASEARLDCTTHRNRRLIQFPQRRAQRTMPTKHPH